MIQTVSLETARLLKESGFRQEKSSYYYCGDADGGEPLIHESNLDSFYGKPFRFISMAGIHAAPTTDELLAELPRDTELCKRMSDYFIVNCEVDSKGYSWTHVRQDASTAVEALAKMWIWLKRENLLPLKESRKV